MFKKYHLIFSFLLVCQVCLAQNTFPVSGAVGVGTTSPSSWFPGTVLLIEGNRPILRLAPLTEGGLSTILLKGKFSEATNGTSDEFHINYVSEYNNPRLVFTGYKNGFKDILTLLGSGYVGIGLENPTEKLSVNGNIRAREVRVTTENWPDYVFDPEYNLFSLSNLKSYLQLNRHLPGIPSAAETSLNGVNLGEMNKKLLEKVEELTLHLIQQDEVNVEQNKKMERLSAEITQLKNKLNKK